MGDTEAPAYLRVARFASVGAMRAASAEVVALLRAHIGDGRNLSSYGIEVDRVPYVVVIGERPMIALKGKRHRVREQGLWVHECPRRSKITP